jgi:TPP-dependent pyruvate/acetoin dehydrogenase alpha subunit
VLLIAETFRLGGHATHDEDEARRTFPNDLFTYWGNRDPIGCYETYLIESGKDLQRADGKVAKRRSASALKTGNQEILAALETQVTAEVEQAAEEALKSRQPQQLATAAETLSNVYAIT